VALSTAVSAVRAAPIVLTDDLGRSVVLSAAPKRIVSLEPSVTEVLYAVGAQNRVVADDDYSDYPPAARWKPHVNGIGPSRETMIGLKPDLIILFDQTFTRAKANQWSIEYRAPVLVLAAATYQGVESDIATIGGLAGDPARTQAVLRRMNSALELVERAVRNRPRPRVFAVVWDRPLMTAGRGSFIDNLIGLAGGVNVAASTAVGYPTYSPERLVSDAPEIILGGTVGGVVTRTADPGLANLNLSAIKNGRCYEIPDDWTSRPGPRLSLGLVAVARVLHPEAFPTYTKLSAQ
jgi:iron complex transport system substrate-binding protein